MTYEVCFDLTDYVYVSIDAEDEIEAVETAQELLRTSYYDKVLAMFAENIREGFPTISCDYGERVDGDPDLTPEEINEYMEEHCFG